MDECCVWVDKAKWDKKEHVWKDKPFYVKHYRSLFYMPIGMGKAVNTSMPMLKKRGLFAGKEALFMCRNEGMWGGDLYLELSKKAADLPVETISGKLFSMYFETKSYKDVGKFMKEIKAYCKGKGWKPLEYMSYYATCPDCAKKFGKMQIILFARLS
jgi:hypothetical protein